MRPNAFESCNALMREKRQILWAQPARGDAKQQAGAFDGYADGRVAMV